MTSPREHPLYHVDAFTGLPFAGNPAAVCLLDGPAGDDWMKQVAAEMNLSETAFLFRLPDGWSLRWFTPVKEVPLCGHATLASAHALWESGSLEPGEPARFHTLSGLLIARRVGTRIEIEMPAFTVSQDALPREAVAALGVQPLESWRTPNRGLGDFEHLLLLATEGEVRGARPDFARLNRSAPGAVLITARAGKPGIDFVSRYFAPQWGIDEDPVTGIAHCSLVPFWTARLGRTEVKGYQASSRGGYVYARLAGDRVFLSGEAVTVVSGKLRG